MTGNRAFGLGRITLLALAGLAVAAVQPAVAYGGGMMGGGGYGAMPGFGFFGFLWPLLFFGGILYLVYAVAGNGSSTGGGLGRSDSAMETLRERYARGELTEEEFEQRRRRLEE
ncbi:MAG: SHOCT domain-containing protein [Halanaeroarchaeum sp.]